MATIEELLGHTGEELAAMSDEQILAYLRTNSILEPVCDESRIPSVKEKIAGGVGNKSKKKASTVDINERCLQIIEEEFNLKLAGNITKIPK